MVNPQERKHIDETSLERLKTAHPRLREELETILYECANIGVGVRYTSVLRSDEEQNALYALGRTKPGKIVTNVQGGGSYHNYGLAVDIVLYLDGGKKVSWDRNKDFDGDGEADWMEVVRIFMKHGS